MTASDDRSHSDCHRAKSESRDIHQKRELVDRNVMKLFGRGWTTWGK
jgi:hypothetical protein